MKKGLQYFRCNPFYYILMCNLVNHIKAIYARVVMNRTFLTTMKRIIFSHILGLIIRIMIILKLYLVVGSISVDILETIDGIQLLHPIPSSLSMTPATYTNRRAGARNTCHCLRNGSTRYRRV